MQRKTMQLQFPRLGVIRRWGYRPDRNQSEYATPYAVNCRMEDSITNRLRGGSFTGIAAGDRPSEILYRDRVLTFDDNAITATRMGDHTDTTLSKDVSDTMRPALFQLSEAGEVGEDIVALIPHKDTHLLCFADSETWVMSGDPATGTLRCVSDEVGIIAEDAWCVNHDIVYFLSSQGLYSVGVDGSGLKPISEDAIPEELTDVDDDDATLTYNHSDRGVYIHKTGTDWFYDTARDQFWPFNTSVTDSHVLLGPFQLGQENSYGRVLNLHGNIADGSDDVTWRLIMGDTAEGAAANGKAALEAAIAGGDYDDYVAAEGTWSAGRSHIVYPRNRALWCCLWLHSEGDWAYENATMTIMLSGKWR